MSEQIEDPFLTDLSLVLLEKSFIALNELKTLFSDKKFPLVDALELLQQKYKQLGIILELIELDNQEYVVLTRQRGTQELQFSEQVYILLGCFAELAKIRGNCLPVIEIAELFNSYLLELKILENSNFIRRLQHPISGEVFSLTPLGAAIIEPVLLELEKLL
jgi:hypothetical protein